jgi:hypothetical protein
MGVGRTWVSMYKVNEGVTSTLRSAHASRRENGERRERSPEAQGPMANMSSAALSLDAPALLVSASLRVSSPDEQPSVACICMRRDCTIGSVWLQGQSAGAYGNEVTALLQEVPTGLTPGPIAATCTPSLTSPSPRPPLGCAR